MDSEAMTPRGKWPPFPWNPPDLDNPMVGRDEAQRALARAFEDVVSDWVVQVQLVVSEYGLGKSRLLSVFMQAAQAREPNTLVIDVRCPSSGGGGGPYRLWDAVLRAAFGISPEADPAEAAIALSRAVERWVPAEVALLVGHLVGLPVDGDEEALMARCIGALGRLLDAIAMERPLLIVVDDASRASARDFALTSALAATVKGRPIMVLLASATNLADHVPGWDRFPVVTLQPLTPDESERMLRLFLTGLAAPPSKELVAHLVSVSHGNSYALKALVRWLHEVGAIRPAVQKAPGEARGKWLLEEARIEGKAVPETLEGVIHARVAALAADERLLLGQAAVVGREFWIGPLIALARQQTEDAPDTFTEDEIPTRIRGVLAKLVSQRYIEVRSSRIRGEECFGFRSGAHWEAALESLPATTLQRWHRIVLAWLELQAESLETPGETLEPTGASHARGQYLSELARHAEGAGQPAAAATYHMRAARVSSTEGHSRAALASLDDALRLVQVDQLATRLRILFDLGEVHALAGTSDLAVEYYREALTLAWRLGDRRTGAMALSKIADVEAAQGAHADARAHLMEALRLFEAIQDPHGVAGACIALGRLHWRLGEFDKALLVYRRSEHLYRRLGHDRGIAEVLHVQAAVHFDRGDVETAERHYMDALALRKASDDRRGLVRTLNNLGGLWMGQKLEKSVEVWREALRLCRDLGDLSLYATLSDNLGEALVLLGRHDEADDMLERAVELAEATGQKATLVDALRNQAGLRIARGQWDRAEQALGKARQEAQELGLAKHNASVLRSIGDLAAARMEATGVINEPGAQSHLQRAEISYRRAAEDFEAAGYVLEAAHSHERLADMLELAGRKAEAASRRTMALALRTDNA